MEIFLFFWERKVTIVKIVGVFFVVGVLISLLSRVEYNASATLMPESQSYQTSASNLLRQYGGMLGISGGQQGGGGISPGLYPDIVSSVPYQVELMNMPVRFSTLDTTMTPHEYFRNFYPPSSMDYFKKYTLGLPGQILSLIKGSNRSKKEPEPVVSKVNRDSVVSLTGPQRSTIGKLKNRINIVDEEGLLTLSVEFPDPRASAEIGNKAINLLKEYVREYRTQKANEELAFVRKQVKEARKRFEEAQIKLAEFRDSNMNLATAKAQTREQELQSQYDLAFNLYNSLVQNLEQAKLKVQENTPVFTTIEPFQVPTSNHKPKTTLIIVVSMILGLIFGIIVVFGKKIWSKYQVES